MDLAYKKLIEILQTYPDGELDFLPTGGGGGGEEVEIQLIQGNVGIPVSIIPHLLIKAYAVLFDKYDSYDMNWINGRNEMVNSSSLVIACFNPECYSIWNYRKDLIKSSYLSAEKEYELTSFLLTRHASKGRIWEYRSYLLDHYLCLNATRPLDRWNASSDEEVCMNSADKYQCNYPSWLFRRKYCLTYLDSVPLFVQELDKVKRFIKRHVSDYSGWSYRQSVWQKLVEKIKDDDETERIKELLFSEIEWIRDFILFYSNHESCWLYYRFLVDICFSSICSRFQFKVDLIVQEAVSFSIDFSSKYQNDNHNDRTENRVVVDEQHSIGLVYYFIKMNLLKSDFLEIETKLSFKNQKYCTWMT